MSFLNSFGFRLNWKPNYAAHVVTEPKRTQAKVAIPSARFGSSV